MDKSEQSKKKAEEFMGILEKRREEADRLKREKYVSRITSIAESIHKKHVEKIFFRNHNIVIYCFFANIQVKK